MWILVLMMLVEGREQCKQGLSLLAHKSSLHKAKSGWYDGYWCPCGGNLDQCVGLLETTVRNRGACTRFGCGDAYPSSPQSCLPYSDTQTNTLGYCVAIWGANCLYTAPVVAENSSCGARACHCTRVPPGHCTAEAMPGYTVVTNGAGALSTGETLTALNGAQVEVADQRVWEPVGTGNRACRGDNATDNEPKHYELHTWIKSLWGCKNKCERTWECRGIEYSPGRCEIWKRQEGLFAYKEIPPEKGEFTCLRYGWPTSKLVPVSSGSHPCRGQSPADNERTNYHLAPVYNKNSFQDIEECKALCAAIFDHEYMQCTGIEWSPGRCEIWQAVIESFNPKVTGYTCLRFDV